MDGIVSAGKTGKGNPLYILDLESYVDSMKDENLFQEKKDDYAVMCPVCREEKQKEDPNYKNLKFWIDKSLEFGRCFVCNSVFISNKDCNKAYRSSGYEWDRSISLKSSILDV